MAFGGKDPSCFIDLDLDTHLPQEKRVAMTFLNFYLCIGVCFAHACFFGMMTTYQLIQTLLYVSRPGLQVRICTYAFLGPC